MASYARSTTAAGFSARDVTRRVAGRAQKGVNRTVLPADWGVVLDPGVRRIDGGAVLVGGSPLRILRLTDAGQRLIDRLEAGERVPQSQGAQRLVRRLLDAGMAHPRPGAAHLTARDVTVVVPVRNGEVAADAGPTTIVVDDGSTTPATHPAATILRHEHTRGPAAARNTGWRTATTDLIAFLDADCRPESGWLDRLLPHFGDQAVAGVAPRIVTAPADTLPDALARYELARPTLDRGEQEAIVRPRSPVPFVPTAALLVRRQALEELDGFDETMRFGEDVDFVWRLAAAGWTVRYDPSVSVAHPSRATAAAWLRQRFDYGTSAAPLARKHGAAVAPLTMSPWSLASWTFEGLGFPLTGAAIGMGTTALLAPRLKGLRDPWGEARKLAGQGHLHAGVAVADAVRRAWWPLAATAALVSRRARRGVLAAAVVPPLLEWRRQRPPLDPARWALLRLLDDMTYGAGVWAGCARERSLAALRPDLVDWPGNRAAVESTAQIEQRTPPRRE